MIVWLASYPRCGNTMTRMLLHSLCGVPTYNIYQEPRSAISNIIGQVRVRKINVRLAQQDHQIYFVKTHELPNHAAHKGVKARAIHIVRDGRDAIVSAAYHSIAKSGHKPTSALLRKAMKFQLNGSWKKHCEEWRKHPRVSMVRFEDLVRNPVVVLRHAVRRIGLPVEVRDAKIPDFKELRRIRPGFFRRGTFGAWRTDLPRDLESYFWAMNSSVMMSMGYRRGL